MRKTLFSSLEDLNVDKVDKAEKLAAKGSEYDQLYLDIQRDQELDGSEENDDGSDELPIDDDGGTPDSEVPDDESTVSTESFLKHHQTAMGVFIAQEDFFTSDNAANVTRYLGAKTVDSLRYLKDIGVEYGPTLLKHVYKGVIYALDKTLKAIILGSAIITKKIQQRVNSFESFKEKIEALRKTIAIMEADKPSETPGVFSDTKIISQLKIDKNCEFDQTLKTVIPFLETFFEKTLLSASTNIIGVRHLVSSVTQSVSGNPLNPNKYMVEEIHIPDFRKQKIDGYLPTSSCVDSYLLTTILPGDLCFMGYLPKKDLTTDREITEAYAESKLFLGMNQKTIAGIEQCDYIPFDRFKAVLDTLDEICDIGIHSGPRYETLIKNRDSLRGDLKAYMKFLMTAQNKISIRESLSNYIAAKTGFLDKTYIDGSIVIQDYMVRLLTSSLAYLKTGIDAYSVK